MAQAPNIQISKLNSAKIKSTRPTSKCSKGIGYATKAITKRISETEQARFSLGKVIGEETSKTDSLTDKDRTIRIVTRKKLKGGGIMVS